MPRVEVGSRRLITLRCLVELSLLSSSILKGYSQLSTPTSRARSFGPPFESAVAVTMEVPGVVVLAVPFCDWVMAKHEYLAVRQFAGYVLKDVHRRQVLHKTIRSNVSW
jgi:hypothetical protein